MLDKKRERLSLLEHSADLSEPMQNVSIIIIHHSDSILEFFYYAAIITNIQNKKKIFASRYYIYEF